MRFFYPVPGLRQAGLILCLNFNPFADFFKKFSKKYYFNASIKISFPFQSLWTEAGVCVFVLQFLKHQMRQQLVKSFSSRSVKNACVVCKENQFSPLLRPPLVTEAVLRVLNNSTVYFLCLLEGMEEHLNTKIIPSV